MATVFTPETVARMVAKGTFRKIKLRELPNTDRDEAFLFIFPSPNIINEINGDGDWIEVNDYNTNFSEIYTDRGTVTTNDNTDIYVR